MVETSFMVNGLMYIWHFILVRSLFYLIRLWRQNQHPMKSNSKSNNITFLSHLKTQIQFRETESDSDDKRVSELDEKTDSPLKDKPNPKLDEKKESDLEETPNPKSSKRKVKTQQESNEDFLGPAQCRRHNYTRLSCSKVFCPPWRRCISGQCVCKMPYKCPRQDMPACTLDGSQYYSMCQAKAISCRSSQPTFSHFSSVCKGEDTILH